MGSIPCVATDVGSVHEIVEDEATGLLTPVESPAITSAVSRLLEDDALRLRLGAAASDVARATFTVERFARAHAEVYEQELSRRRVRP